MTSKGDLINGAYSRMRVSGLTSQPTPEDLALALRRLESQAARWNEKSVCAGYNFEDTPDTNSPSGLKLAYVDAFESVLATRLLIDFGKQAAPELVAEARTTFNDLQTATLNVNRVQYPNRMPLGSGNRRFIQNRRNYFYPAATAPNSCETIRMDIGDIADLVEHFDAYLGTTEDLASYTLEASSGLTVQTQSLVTPDVLYRVLAVGGSSGDSSVDQVKIVATTDTGRVETRLINFELTRVEL